MKIKLEKGHTALNITIPDNQVINTIVGKNVPRIDHEKIKQIISKGIQLHTPKDITQKKIVIIIPDNTRLWARGDIFVPQIVKTLFKAGVSKKNIKIIIALGTHDDMNKDMFPQLAGTYCSRHVDILNSANTNKDRLIHMGKTRRGTQVYFTKEAVEADHIIIFGGILHHMTAGFGGGRKYIFPGIAGYDSIQQNHSLAMEKDGSPHPSVRQSNLKENPIHEDINEAATLFLKDKTCTYVAIAANGTGDIFHVDVGPLHETFIKGCKKVDQACSVHVPKKGDFVLISAGGHRTDMQLYQATKALFNAINIVKQGGQILFVAGCSQGVGNETFSSVLKEFKNNASKLGKILTKNFSMPAYVAFRVLDLQTRFKITLISDFGREETTALGFHHSNQIETYIQNLKGKGYIIPFAENILPLVKDLN